MDENASAVNEEKFSDASKKSDFKVSVYEVTLKAKSDVTWLLVLLEL